MTGLTAILLCGGRSTRMGRDKASLPFGTEPMLGRIARILRSISDDVIIVGRRDQDASTIHDAVEDQGPLAGIAAGLTASKTDLNIVVACDMPLIKPAVLERLVSLINDNDMCVAVVDDHPSVLCGVYRARVASDAQALLDSGERRVMRLLDRVKVKRVDAALLRDIDPNLETFTSVDTPEAYQKLTRTSPII
jgi:molybdopterin-guanine dinucleotide biosynthesis protein A